MGERVTSYRILYRDTDAMGLLYYGRYLELFELGRVEWMRAQGFRYRDMETEHGLLLPVTAAWCRYLTGLHYDDEARIHTWIRAWSPTTVRFAHRIQAAGAERVAATGEVELGCLRRSTGRPARIPPALLAILEETAGDRKGRLRGPEEPRNP